MNAQKLNWFAICYWASATVQVVGSYSVFGSVGNSPLHAIAGGLCLELLILALNNYGASQRGKWMAFICSLSLALIAVSAMLQVADLLSHDINAELATRLGPGLYGLLRVVVPAMPSVAMAAVTLIKFVDAKRGQTAALAAPAAQGEAFDPAALSQTLRSEWRAELAAFAASRPTQAVQVNFQQPATQQPAPLAAATQEQVDEQPAADEPLQLAGPDASLQVAIAELQGRPLIEALPLLQERGFSKAAIAAAIGRQPYQLAPSKLKPTEILK